MAAQSKVATNETLWLNMILNLWNAITKSKSRKLMSLAAVISVLYLIKKQNNSQRLQSPDFKSARLQKNRNKGNVDKYFFKRITHLWHIVCPKFNDKVTVDIALLTVFLIARTYLSIFISGANGRIVKSIIKLNFSLFLKRLAMIAIPASFVNSQLDFLNKRLSVTFRQRLTKYFQGIYLKEMVFYQITNLDSRIANPDQRLTADIDKWSNSLSQIYSNFTKPMLDIILFSKKLSELVGWIGPSMIIAWYFASAVVIKFVSPPFGRLTAIEQRLEGQYRACHTDLLHHSEEIAFYKGNVWERERVKSTFKSLEKHIKSVNIKKLFMGTFDSMLVKYGAVMIGYTVVGLPVFGPGSKEYLASVANDPSAITRDYVRNSSLLINLAKGIGRLVISYKEIQQLAGYTTLVSEMQDVVLELNQGKYQRQLIGKDLETYGNFKQGVVNTVSMNYKAVEETEDKITFDEIPIVTPSGDTLVQKISFEVKPGMNVIVTGPNGCGKSSLFRILGGLWPIFSGKLGKPAKGKIFYVAQRPYLPPGTLRDQIIYPDSKLDMLRKKVSDNDLRELLEKVSLGYIEGREKEKGGFDFYNEWNDYFSGGEKQRVAMARMFYHKPTFAILDECTSAVSLDVENSLYSTAKEKNITLFTVSHKPQLFKHHDYILRFDDETGYTFKKYVEAEEIPIVAVKEYTNEQLYCASGNNNEQVEQNQEQDQQQQ